MIIFIYLQSRFWNIICINQWLNIKDMEYKKSLYFSLEIQSKISKNFSPLFTFKKKSEITA